MADTRPGAGRRILRWIDYRLPFVADRGARALRISDPAQPELLVEFRLARRDHAGGHDRHRRLPGDAVHAELGSRLQFGRAHHARRQLRLADALHPHERRVDVLCHRLHPPLPRALLRLVQAAARTAVDARRRHPAADDGDRVHGLCAALGPDELLGRHRHHQPVLGDPAGRPRHRDLAVGRLHGRQSDPATASSRCTTCLPFVIVARGRAASDRAAHARLEQSARHRHARGRRIRSRSIPTTRSRTCSG